MNLVSVTLFFALILFAALFYFFIAGFFRSPFVPSNRKTIEKMLKVAKLKKGERVIDLGCGDGRVIFLAEKKFRVQAEGYEVSIFVWLLAQINRLLKRAKAPVYRRNFFQANISKADVIFCYLLPEVMQRLSPKFKKELKRGARIISASFSLHDWKAEKVYPKEGKVGKVFVYRK